MQVPPDPFGLPSAAAPASIAAPARAAELGAVGAEAKVQTILGEADTEPSKIYTEAYSQSPESEEFYRFIKTMETYKLTLSQKDLLILSTKSEFFNFLKEIKPKPAAPK